jgi:long-chain acyl-CoA synthetase
VLVAEVNITESVHRAVQVRRNAIATVFEGRRRTWYEFQERVARLAAGLKACGLERGDRVAIIAHNSDLYIETYYAIAWAGGVSVPNNCRWSETEHVYALTDSAARFLIVDKNFQGQATSLSGTCEFAAVLLMDNGTDSNQRNLVTTEDLIETHPPTADVCGRDDDLCVIFYTGGTTGRSKGVMLSHRNLLSTILAGCATSPYPPDPIFLHAPPLFHISDAGAMLAVTLHAGTHVVLSAFSPAAVVHTIEREGVTVALMGTTMLRAIHEYLQTT